ncbi:unnamed protein product [Arabis nemorensis]|uniref:NYN domain-containing protein n=1 Tax=Arabis nemorensis TaxID=586526 RepID=A0A565CMW3_9BRAS|nr:unnamed protein product [Arabis nemorensis]
MSNPPSTEILLDLENGVPKTVTFADAFINTRKYIYGLNGSLVHAIRAFYSTAASRKRDDADIALKYDMLFWELSYPPPAPICLISSDKDYWGTMERMVKTQYEIILAYNAAHASKDIKDVAVTDSFDFPSVAKGILTIPTPSAMPLGLGTSPPSRPLPPSPSSSELLKLKVLLDVNTSFDNTTTGNEKCMPKGLTPTVMRENIELFLKSKGYGGITGSIQVIARSGSLSEQLEEEMVNSGFAVTNVDPPTREKKAGEDHTDVRIGQVMQRWCLELQQLAPMVIISSDSNLTLVVKRLDSMGFPVMLAYGPSAPPELLQAAREKFPWGELIAQ